MKRRSDLKIEVVHSALTYSTTIYASIQGRRCIGLENAPHHDASSLLEYAERHWVPAFQWLLEHSKPVPTGYECPTISFQNFLATVEYLKETN